MIEFASAKGRRYVVGVHEPFLLKDPSKATIASAFSFSIDKAIAARRAVNWNKKKNQLGLQLAVHECGGLKHLKTGNVPTDENLLIAFLKWCNLPETLSRSALIQKMRLTRLENGYLENGSITNVNWKKEENHIHHWSQESSIFYF